MYSTAALLTNVIPVVTVPLVAKAHAAGDTQEVQRQVGGAIFLSLVLGTVVTLLVGFGRSRWLLAVGSAAALPFSLPYLLYRLPGVLPVRRGEDRALRQELQRPSGVRWSSTVP